MKQTSKFLGISAFWIFLLILFFNPTTEEGYKMGNLVDVTTKGIFINSTECKLSMGLEGESLIVRHYNYRLITDEVINPWSFTYKGIEPLSDHIGKYQLVHYRQKFIHNIFIEDTSYISDSVVSISDAPLSDQLIRAENYDPDKISGGVFGCLVQVAESGKIFKTYTASVQVGTRGSDYLELGIEDEALYQFAINAIQRGSKLRIYYTNRWFKALFPWTTVRRVITSMEVVNIPIDPTKGATDVR